MTPLPGWHPLLVHFPLALIATAASTLTLARLLPAGREIPGLAVTGTWNLCLGAVTLLPALGSGLAAAVDLHVGAAAHAAVSLHVRAASLTAVLVLLAALWRGVGVAPDSRPTWPFLLVLWAATAALVVTGYRGGENVYRYGVGVSAVADSVDARSQPP